MLKKRVKATIAFLLLIALLTQTSYSAIANIANFSPVYAGSEDTDLSENASEVEEQAAVTEEPVAVETENAEEEDEEPVANESIVEEPSELSEDAIEVVSENGLGMALTTASTSYDFGQDWSNGTLSYKLIDQSDETFENTKYYNKDLALGIAGNFHIVAFNAANLGSHTNGNVLTRNLYADSNFGTKNYKDELSYVQDSYPKFNATSASSSSHVLALGSNINVGLTDHNNAFSINGNKLDCPHNIYQDADSETLPFIDLDQVEEDVKKISNSLASNSNASITADLKAGGGITLTDLNSVGFFNMTASQLNQIGSGAEFGIYGFQSNADGSVIINVDCSGVSTIKMPRGYIYIDGKQQSTNEVTTFENGKVIWNFINAEGCTITTDLMTGTVIALGASVEMPQNLNGTVIAENTHNSGETHRTDFTGKTTPTSTGLSVKKNFDGTWPEAGFQFELKAIGNLANETSINGEKFSTTNPKTVVATDSTAVAFGTIDFPTWSDDTESKSYYYQISETDQKQSNIQYDQTCYDVKVVVTKSKSGSDTVYSNKMYYKLSTAAENAYKEFTQNDFSFEFTNTEKTADLELRKSVIVAGTDTAPKCDFYATVQDASGKYVAADGSLSDKKTVITIPYTQASGTFACVKITGLVFGATYTVTEVNKDGTAFQETGDGYSIDSYTTSTVGVVRSVVLSNDSKSTSVNYVHIKNVYATKGNVTLSGNKTVNGVVNASVANKFTFHVYEADSSYKVTNSTAVAKGTNGQDGKINFDKELSYTGTTPGETQTHYYVVKEDASNLSGYSDNTTIIKMKVVLVDDGAGKLIPQVTYDGASGIVFDNTYTANGSIDLSVKKILSGRDFTNQDSFTFVLEDSNGNELSSNTVNAAVYKAGGNVSFLAKDIKALNYTLSDIGSTKTYYIEETNKGQTIEGLSYSNQKYKIDVTISDSDGDGNLTCVKTITPMETGSTDTADSNGVMIFTNTYQSTNGTIQIGARKDFTNAPVNDNHKFTFQLKDNGDNAAKGQNKTVQEEKSCTGSGSIEFSEISYNKAGTYNYTLQEVLPTGYQSGDIVNGVKYDTQVYNIVVTVADNGKGKLLASYTVNGKASAEYVAVFTNEYSANGSVSINGTKMITGVPEGTRSPKKNEFSFILADEKGNLLKRVSNEAGGAFAFGADIVKAFNYTLSDCGVHTYYVYEETGTDSNFKYSTNKYKVKVTVTDQKNGTLKCTPVYYDGDTVTTSIVFKNELESKNSIVLSANKVLTGTSLKDDQFSFILSSQDDADFVEQTKTNKGASITFDPINYTMSDAGKTYHYTVSEKNTDAFGYVYDTTVYTATVLVQYNQNTDHLDISKTIADNKGNSNIDEMNFENSYSVSTDIIIAGTKTVPNRGIKAGDEFKFSLKDTTPGDIFTKADDQTVTAGTDGSFSFKKINYTQDDIGTHTYKVTEVIPADEDKVAGITYDTNEFTVNVTVTIDEDGKLVAAQSIADGKSAIGFNNTYNAEGEMSLAAYKTVSGRTFDKNEFAFTVSGDATRSAKCDEAGNITFDKFSYKLADLGDETSKDFVYYICETKGNNAYQYDDTYYKAVITVTNDGSGSLRVSDPVYYKNGSTKVDQAVFLNTYEAKGTTDVSGVKTVDGINSNVSAGQFTFELKNEAGVVLATATNDAKGDFTIPNNEGFGTYTQADLSDGNGGYLDSKTYHYTLSEKDESSEHPGYTYDKSVYAVDVTIKDETADGKLEISKNIKKISGAEQADKNWWQSFWENIVSFFTGNTSEDVQFVNKYAAKGQLTLSADKTLMGRTLADTATPQFSFILTGKDENGNNINETKSCDANGKVTFSTISYNKAGVYSYTIKEEQGTSAGYVYDGAEYTVNVNVTDQGNGDLAVAKTISKKINGQTTTADAIVFHNSYDATGNFTVNGSKTMLGKAFATGDYSVVMKNVAGQVVDQQNITADATGKSGSFTLGQSYSLSQISATPYEYTISEVKGTEAGVTYDESVYKVSVSVTDPGTGVLSVVPTIKNSSNETVGAVSFTNQYLAKGAVVLSANKILEGRNLQENQFGFELVSNNNVLQTVYNDANGNVYFQPVQYSEQDAGKNFSYQIREINNNITGYTYDSRVYDVSVKVELAAGSDELLVTKTISCNGAAVSQPVFENNYESHASVSFNGTKSLTGRALNASEFSFELLDGDRNVIGNAVTNQADGSFSFPEITYSNLDVKDEPNNTKVYNYYIREVSGNLAGVSYATTEYPVSVTVQDDCKGCLTATMSGIPTAGISFVNEYAADGDVNITASKGITGKLLENEFQFKLSEADQNFAATKEIETVTNAGANVVFKQIHYTQEDVGSHYYIVEEIPTTLAGKTDKDGYTFDSIVHKVQVNVSLDQNSNKLVVTKIVDGTVNGSISFNNTYHAYGETQFGGSKILQNKDLKAGDFSFALYDENGAVLDTVSNDAAGNFQFKTLSYNEIFMGGKTSKDVKYTVKEVPGNDANITYSNLSYEVVVHVEDNQNGTLTATPATNDATRKFTNVYNANGNVTFQATKELTGHALEKGQFSFELQDVSGNVIDTKKNDGASVTFKTISYDATDIGKTFTYTIHEVSDNQLAGYSYDTSVQTVTVTVTDGGEGTLATDVSYSSGAAVFKNQYSANGNIIIEGTKTLENKNLTAGMFTFQLMDENGNIVETTNQADGTFDFPSLTFTEADLKGAAEKDFYYKVVEKQITVAGITNSTEEYLVKIHVKDNNQGSLIVTKEVSKLGADQQNKSLFDLIKDFVAGTSNEISFTNTYSATGSFTFDLLKTVSNNDTAFALQAGQYTFIVTENGQEVARGTNAADGSVKIELPKFTNETAATKGTTHKYVISEIADENRTGMVYDSKQYEVSVIATDNGNGTITVNKTGDNWPENDVFTFVNKTTKTEFSKTDITTGKELPGAILRIEDEKGNVVKDAAGNDITWTTGTTAHVIEGELKPGEYYLVETSAPAGFTVAEKVLFTVNADGTVTKVKMENKPEDLTFSKVSLADDKELAGAELSITDNETGNIISSWTSDGTIKTVSGTEFVTGKAYTMTETAAPAGYTIANKIVFEVVIDEKGNRTIQRIGDDGTISGAMVTMKDDLTNVSISKKAATGDDELSGAKLQIVATKDCSYQGKNYQNGDVIVEWTSGETQKTISGLSAGEYVLHEDSAPNGYVVASNITFTVTNQGISAPVVMIDDKNGETSLSGTKTWIAPAGTEYPDVTIELLRREKGETDWNTVSSQTINESNQWTYCFAPLQEKNPDNANDYEYSIKEVSVNGFTTSMNVISTNRVDVRNTISQDTVSLNGTKTWIVAKKNNKAVYELPEKIIIHVSQNGAPYQYKELVPDAQGNKQDYSFKDLPKYDLETGIPYVYTVTEEIVGGENSYKSTMSGNDITNQELHDPLKITGSKTWVDLSGNVAGKEITINLFRDKSLGQTEPFRTTTTTATVRADGTYEYQYEFDHLYEYRVGLFALDDASDTYDAMVSDPSNSLAGESYEYTVEEVLPDGAVYTVSYKGTSDGNIIRDLTATSGVVDITNTLSQEEISVKGNKTWVVNQEMVKSEDLPAVTFELVRWTDQNTEKKTVSSVSVQTTNGYAASYEFTNLPKYDYADGKVYEFHYDVNEIVPDGFASQKDGYDFVNTSTKQQFSKVDLTDGTELKGASLEIRYVNADGTIGDVVKDANGNDIAWISDGTQHYVEGVLKPGNYVLRETTAPYGYEIAEDVKFEVKEDGEIVSVTMQDARSTGDVTLIKTGPTPSDNSAAKTLAGAKFYLCSKNPHSDAQKAMDPFVDNNYWIYGEYTTDDNGQIYVDNLPWDDYYFVETEAPEGYVIPMIEQDGIQYSVAYRFTIGADKENGQTLSYKLTVENDEEETAPPKKPKKKSSSSSEETYTPKTPGGNITTGVLGAIGAPTSGVLGDRVAPLTGDNLNMVFWSVLMAGAFGVIICIVVFQKKKKKVKSE